VVCKQTFGEQTRTLYISIDVLDLIGFVNFHFISRFFSRPQNVVQFLNVNQLDFDGIKKHKLYPNDYICRKDAPDFIGFGDFHLLSEIIHFCTRVVSLATPRD
jgi:hypothetical protein